jgi:predicted phosphodiesterase
MSRIAVFSDVHGNLPALKATLKDIEDRDVDQVFCLGDLVDCAPWTNEVIELIRTSHITCLMGNHDERIAFDLPLFRLKKHSIQEAEARELAIAYTRRTVSDRSKDYLAGLPAQLSLGFDLNGQKRNLLMVHGSPRSNDEYIYPNHDAQDLITMMDENRADILMMGHTHQSFIREEELEGRIVINCGSVGRSKEGEPLASYALLELSPSGINAEIVKLPYPVTETIAAIKSSPIPDFYADFLSHNSFSV